MAPVRVAMEGTPAAIASINMFGHPSDTDGSTNTSRLLSHPETSS